MCKVYMVWGDGSVVNMNYTQILKSISSCSQKSVSSTPEDPTCLSGLCGHSYMCKHTQKHIIKVTKS